MEYQELMDQPIEVDLEPAYDLALRNSPRIASFEQGVRFSDESLRLQENQMRPELRVEFSAAADQVDEAFGYESAIDAISHIHEPDKTNFFIGLRYTTQLFRAVDKARLSRARIERKQAQDRLVGTRNDVAQRVGTTANEIYSSTGRIDQARQDLELAAGAYGKAVELQERGLVTQFEALRRFDDLLTARLSLIDARADLQRANAGLLSTQGVLDERYTLQ
jgi:outer membrane protein TolC